MEPDIVSEVRVSIKLGVPSISRPPAIHVPSKDVDDAMLDLLRNFAKVHVVAASRGTLHLKFRAIVLVEPLEGFDQKEICCEPDGSYTAALAVTLTVDVIGKTHLSSWNSLRTCHS